MIMEEEVRAILDARREELAASWRPLRWRTRRWWWRRQSDTLCDTAVTARGGDDMDTTTALSRFEAALTDQAALAGDDPALDAASRTLLAALRPAARELALDLAEQAAAEVGAQLPDHDVAVVLQAGEPVLSVRERAGASAGARTDESYEARLTLRLPPSLKRLVEDAATTTGDSVNSWVVDALSGAASRSRRGAGRHVRGRVQT